MAVVFLSPDAAGLLDWRPSTGIHSSTSVPSIQRLLDVIHGLRPNRATRVPTKSSRVNLLQSVQYLNARGHGGGSRIYQTR